MYFRTYYSVPRLRNPRKFTERLCAMKLQGLHSDKVPLTDKVLVKDFVREKIGPDYVVPTLWHGKQLPPQEDRKWTPPFVIKANHGSAMNYFVQNHFDLDWNRIEGLVTEWMRRDWPSYLCEDWYNLIDRQLLVEPVLQPDAQDLRDYKIFVFGGTALFVQVDSDRFQDHRRDFYDLDWVRVPFCVTYPNANDPVPRPIHLQKMLATAEELAADFEFVRVDLYDLAGGPKFGEMTFAPGAGLEPFSPALYDDVLGQLWRNGTDSSMTKAEQRRRAKELLHGAVR